MVVERRAEEPVIPLRLFRSSVFTASNIAAFAVAMVMFGSIIYIPVYAQGVLGVDATNSGLILMPLMLGLVVMGILSGLVITRTGRYKGIMLSGVAIMGAGLFLLTRLTWTSTQTQLTVAMVVLGVGLGMAMQQYTLVVQNAVARADLGVATASTQFFRNVGSTVGIAVFGTVMTSGLAAAIAGHLPAEVAARMPAGSAGAGSVLDPAALAGLPPVVADAVRQGLADQLHLVFLLALPLVAVVFLATLAIKPLPLRETANAEVGAPEEAGHELLDAMSQSAPDDSVGDDDSLTEGGPASEGTAFDRGRVRSTRRRVTPTPGPGPGHEGTPHRSAGAASSSVRGSVVGQAGGSTSVWAGRFATPTGQVSPLGPWLQ